MIPSLYVVTGAPGSGKSTTLAAFLNLHTPLVAFDIDWLTLPASHLAEKDVVFDSSTWPAYQALWFAILGMMHSNHKQPVFFTALSPQMVLRAGLPPWCTCIEWLLLDCPDAVRQRRLRQRLGWTAQMIEEAISEAAELRSTVQRAVNTDRYTPEDVAGKIVQWIASTTGH